MKKNRCGIITSGGDAPGMNKIIYDLCYLLKNTNTELVLIKNGLRGLYNKEITNIPLEILHNTSFQSSSIIGTSRFPEFINNNVREQIKKNIKELGLEKLIIIGGDGSYEASKLLIDDIQIIFIPSTIDNDFVYNHLTLGYYSCLEYIVKTVFNISLSAKSHQQIHMIELMGNKSSKLIFNSKSILNDVMFIETSHSFNDEFKRKMIQKYQKESYLVILIKEKIMDIKERDELINEISNLLKEKVRVSILGYAQRSCDVSLNDLIYSSVVSKYISKNINELSNIIVSYSEKEISNIKTTIIQK